MVRTPPRRSLATLIVIGSSMAAGCAKNDGLKLYPVAGRVLVDGKPLTNVGQGAVSFRADAARGNDTLHQPTGLINAAGEYELVTVNKKGAPPGWYKVLVNAYANRLEEGPVTPRPLLHPKYYSVATTDLSIEVTADPPPEAYDLRVTRAAAQSP